MEEVVGSSHSGGQNFSHGKLSKIDPLVLKSHLTLNRWAQFLYHYIDIFISPISGDTVD